LNQGPVPVVLGQTAVGKTSVAIELSLLLRGEVISADAMQVYREMKLATAKPSEAERRGVPHHLMDFLDLDEPYSVVRFRNLALELIPEIRRRGRLPLVVGGSALYIKALVDGLSSGPAPDEAYRRRLEMEEKKHGRGYLLRRLLELDPETGRRLHPHDLKRIIRALEVLELTGQTISSQQVHWDGEDPRRGPARDAGGDTLPPEYVRARAPVSDFFLIGLRRAPEDLEKRIVERIDGMLADGLLEETRELIRMGARDHRVAWQALGYKEIERCLEGECTLEEARSNLISATRRFAKRQMTWWKKDERIRWVPIDSGEAPAVVAERVAGLIRAALGE